jgi:hypothetical protein
VVGRTPQEQQANHNIVAGSEANRHLRLIAAREFNMIATITLRRVIVEGDLS